MELNIKSTNLELTPAIRAYVEEKILSAEKYMNHMPVTNCDVEVELTTNHHHKGDIFRAEVNLSVGKDLLRVEKTESDLYKAIDKVKDHLIDLVKKHKEKRLAKDRKMR
jgi:putative sigma-54 modulation protein